MKINNNNIHIKYMKYSYESMLSIVLNRDSTVSRSSFLKEVIP